MTKTVDAIYEDGKLVWSEKRIRLRRQVQFRPPVRGRPLTFHSDLQTLFVQLTEIFSSQKLAASQFGQHLPFELTELRDSCKVLRVGRQNTDSVASRANGN